MPWGPCNGLPDLLLADHMHEENGVILLRKCNVGVLAAPLGGATMPLTLFTAFLVPLPRPFLRLFGRHRPHLLQLRRSLRGRFREPLP